MLIQQHFYGLHPQIKQITQNFQKQKSEQKKNKKMRDILTIKQCPNQINSTLSQSNNLILSSNTSPPILHCNSHSYLHGNSNQWKDNWKARMKLQGKFSQNDNVNVRSSCTVRNKSTENIKNINRNQLQQQIDQLLQTINTTNPPQSPAKQPTSPPLSTLPCSTSTSIQPSLTLTQCLLIELSTLQKNYNHLKNSSQQKISYLQTKLINFQQKYEQLQGQFYGKWEGKIEDTKKYVQIVEKQLEKQKDRGEERIKDLLREIDGRDRGMLGMEGRVREMENQVRDYGRMLRVEREQLNDKIRQNKGMQMLIQQYRCNLQQTHIQLSQKTQKITSLQQKILSLTSQLQSSTSQTQSLESKLSTLQSQISNLSNSLSQSSQSTLNLQSQLSSLNNVNTESTLKITNLQKQAEQYKKNIDKLEKIVEGEKSKYRDGLEEMRKGVQIVQRKYRKKMNIMAEFSKREIGKIRAEMEKMRKGILRDVAKGYCTIKMSILGIQGREFEQIKGQNSSKQNYAKYQLTKQPRLNGKIVQKGQKLSSTLSSFNY